MPALSLALLLEIGVGQVMPGPSLNLGGGAPVANASGILDLSKCADGSTNYPCAATEATVKPVGGTVTVSAPASVCVPSATGTPVLVGANDLCLATSDGARIYSAAAHGNLITYSSDARSWTQRAGNPVTVTYSATGGPTNGPYSALVGVGAAGAADVYVLLIGAATSGVPTPLGVWVKKTSPSGTVAIKNPYGNSYGNWSLDLAAMGSGWEWITKDHPAVTVSNSFASSGTNTGVQFSTPSGTINFAFAIATMQNNSAILGPPVETSGTPVSGSADVPYIDAASNITDAKGCVGAKFTPPATVGVSSRIIGTLTTAATPLYLANATALGFYDGATASTLSVTPSMAGREMKVASCWSGTSATLYNITDNTSGPAVYDGVWMVANRRLYLGSDGGNTAFLNGAIKKVCQGSALATVKKCLEAP